MTKRAKQLSLGTIDLALRCKDSHNVANRENTYVDKTLQSSTVKLCHVSSSKKQA